MNFLGLLFKKNIKKNFLFQFFYKIFSEKKENSLENFDRFTEQKKLTKKS